MPQGRGGKAQTGSKLRGQKRTEIFSGYANELASVLRSEVLKVLRISLDSAGAALPPTGASPPRPGTRHHEHHRGPVSPKRRLSWSPVFSPENEPAGPMPETPHGLARKRRVFRDSFWVPPPPPPPPPVADQQRRVSNESSSLHAGSYRNNNTQKHHNHCAKRRCLTIGVTQSDSSSFSING